MRVLGRLPRRIRLYLAAALAALPGIAAAWHAQRDDVVVLVGYPLLVIYLCVVSWLLVRRPGWVRAAERATFAVVTGLWLMRLASGVLLDSPMDGWNRVTPWSFMVLALMSLLGYVVFGTREALRYVTAIPVLSGAIAGAALVPDAVATGDWSYVVELIRYETFLVLTIVLVHGLALHKDEAAEAQLEAERLRAIAHHDALTGLPNRRRLEEVLARQVAAAEALGRPLSVIFFDLDHFKDINDTFGHAVGDVVLQRAAEAVTEEARTRDTVGRWGGEEFLVVVPGADAEQAEGIAERLRRAVAVQDYPVGVRVTASFGVAQHRPGAPVAEILTTADTGLYQAKHAGRDAVRGVGGTHVPPAQRGQERRSGAETGRLVEGDPLVGGLSLVEGGKETPQQA